MTVTPFTSASVRALSALAFLTMLGACSTRARTQVMVEVHAEPGVRAQLTRVRLTAQGFDATGLEAGELFERDVSAPLTFPISLAIVPQGEDATRTFRFEAVGFAGSDPVSTVRARSGFRAGQTLRLVLVLEDACVGVTCSALETCRAGACVDATVDPATLLPLDSDASIDASRPDAAILVVDDTGTPIDIGTLPDTGSDAFTAMDDAGTDAGSDAPVIDAFAGPDVFGDAGPCGLDTTVTYCPAESACFDLLNDDSHCGSCDDFCIGGRSCNAGVCIFESTGAEGAFRPATSMVLAPGVHNFTVINIPAGVTITTSGEGTLDLRAIGAITVNGTLDVSGGDGANGINPTATYGGSGGGGGTGNPAPASSSGGGCGAAGMGGEGGRGADGTSGGSGGCTPEGGSLGGGVGGTWGGGGSGGGGHAGGGGGAGGTGRGGNGGSSAGETGGGGGDNVVVMSRPHGTEGRGGAAPGLYAGGDGVEAPRCRDLDGWWTGGGGGGSIGRAAAEDLTVASTFRPGSGGGGGGSHAQGGGASDGGAGGGGGGGAVRLSSPVSITIGASGRVLADGGDGGDLPSPESSGAGGGGSGGLVYLAAPVLTLDGRVSARGGAGGTNAACGADGGDGGPGRVRISVDPSMCTLGGSASIEPSLPGGACAATGIVEGSAYLAAWPN